MTNEEVFTAFEEFLQVDPQWRSFMAVFDRARIVGHLRELAAAIDPVPLAEVTQREISIFVRDHKTQAVPMRPLPLSVAEIMARLAKAKAELRFDEYKAAMLCFRDFRLRCSTEMK